MSPPDAALEAAPLSRDLRVRAAAYAGVVFAYLAAVKNDPLTPLQLIFFAAASAWSLGFEGRWRRPFFSQPVKIALIGLGAMVFVGFVARGAGGNAERFANNIADFLFWNAIVFVLSRHKSEYDFWTLAIIELSLFMISGSFVQPALFLPLLAASAGCLVYTFLRIAWLRCGPAGEVQRGGWGVALVTLLLALEVGAAAFVLFPRRVFRGDRPAGAEARTKLPPPPGESVPSVHERTGVPKNPDLLDLRTYHALKIDARPALRVRVRDLQGRPVSPDLTPYLRGAILETYVGGEWTAAPSRRTRRDADDGAKDQWTRLETSPPPGRLLVRQQVHATALAGAVAHLLPDVQRVQLPEVRYDDAAGVVTMPSTPREYVEYYADSALMPVSPPRLKEPVPAPAALLQMPAGLEQVRAEARRLSGSFTELQIDAKVNRFQHFLMHNGFTYKADPFVPAKGQDPAEHFLEKRAGFCIHYASALVLLCRAAGVPARVATGFQLHDPEEDGSFLVRLSDAHAWAEVWFGPDHGWRAYDATPSEGRMPAPPEGAPVASLDLKKPDPGGPGGRWDRLIVEFDPDAQGETLRGTLKAVGAFVVRILAFLVSPWVLGTIAALNLAGVVAWLCLPGAQKRRLRQLAAGFRETATVDFYRDFLWTMSKRGLRKPAGVTPLEFARQVKAHVADEGIDFLTAKFYETRYGGRPPSAEDRRRIDAVLESLIKSVNVRIGLER